MQSYLPDIPPRRPSRAAWLSLASQMSVTDAKLVLHIIKVCRTWEESTPMFVSFWNLTAKASNSNTACVHLFHKVCAYLKVQQYTRVTLKWGTVKKTDTDILYSGLVLPFSKSFTFKLSPTCVLPAPTGNPKKKMFRKDNNYVCGRDSIAFSLTVSISQQKYFKKSLCWGRRPWCQSLASRGGHQTPRHKQLKRERSFLAHSSGLQSLVADLGCPIDHIWNQVTQDPGHSYDEFS